MDEFSKFLDEFEDEVLTDKKSEEGRNPEKKPRPETERKIVDGKKMRKKMKVKRPENGRTPSLSPEGEYWRRRQSPVRNSPFQRDPNSRGRNNRQSPGGKNGERNSRPKDEKETNGEYKESRAEWEERERKEYEERISKLPTPERERLEARRKKFQAKVLSKLTKSI